MGWIKGTEIYVNDTSPQTEQAVFVNTYTGVGGAPGTYHQVDLSAKVPEGTKAVHLTGILIITHGTTSETADLKLHIRTTASAADPNYAWQCIEAAIGNGQRSTMATWVALDENRCFEFKYDVTNPGTTWPTYAAYGINLRMDAYVK